MYLPRTTSFLALLPPAVSRRTKDIHLSSPASFFRPNEGRRIVICDYNQLLQSVTGLLRMSGYAVFQAYDAQAARELCGQLDNIDLLILNTTGTGTDSAQLVHDIRHEVPGLPVLHIGDAKLDGMPDDVPTLGESFDSAKLLGTVAGLLQAR
jgi:hypothetical protein